MASKEEGEGDSAREVALVTAAVEMEVAAAVVEEKVEAERGVERAVVDLEVAATVAVDSVAKAVKVAVVTGQVLK